MGFLPFRPAPLPPALEGHLPHTHPLERDLGSLTDPRDTLPHGAVPAHLCPLTLWSGQDCVTSGSSLASV